MKSLIFAVLMVGSFSASAVWTCTTSKNGNSFTSKGATQQEASRNTTRRCRQAAGADNGQCRTNLNCRQVSNSGGGGGHWGGGHQQSISCRTESNGYNFNEWGYRSNRVRERVINRCLSNFGVTAFECQVNVSCNDGSYTPPMVTCDTRSNGQFFSDQSKNSALTRNHVIEKCQNSWGTNFNQCSRNARCGNEVRPTPTPGHGFNGKALDVANKVRDLVTDMRWNVPQYQFDSLVSPLKDQADRLTRRINNGATKQRIRNTMIHMRTLISGARPAAWNAFSYTNELDYIARMDRLDRRLERLISQL